MEWINIEEAKPPLNVNVLLWAKLGHEMNHHIGFLHDSNDKKGYVKYTDVFGITHTDYNKSYPSNLRWHITGGVCTYDQAMFWAYLPTPPSI